MSIQIALRLPDDLVEYVDVQVASGSASSRAAVVVRALEQDRRRQVAERDAEIYSQAGRHDLDDLASWAASQSMDLD